MATALANGFVCPSCRGALEVRDGHLACAGCSASYPIVDRMPCLLPVQAVDAKTARAFGTQWDLQASGAYEETTIYGETEAMELQSFLDRFGIVDPRSLDGKRILDIGCGSGRLTRNLALYAPGAWVAGGDLSSAARIAHRRCRDLPNAFVAQMDLLVPPFEPDSFDLVYADGVLGHVPDLEQALASLDRLVRPGGKLFCWTYPTSFSPYRFVRDALVQPWRLPLAAQRSIEWMAGVPLWAAFKIFERMRGPRRRSLGEVIFTLHDNLAPPFQHRRSPDAFAAAFRALGYRDVHALDPPSGIVGTKPTA
jgi:SAM-dependent methyltransferase